MPCRPAKGGRKKITMEKYFLQNFVLNNDKLTAELKNPYPAGLFAENPEMDQMTLYNARYAQIKHEIDAEISEITSLTGPEIFGLIKERDHILRRLDPGNEKYIQMHLDNVAAGDYSFKTMIEKLIDQRPGQL